LSIKLKLSCSYHPWCERPLHTSVYLPSHVKCTVFGMQP